MLPIPKITGAYMQVDRTPVHGLLVITLARFGDDRGFFAETCSQKKLAGHGAATNFVQDNHSLSAQAGTLRGLHFQRPPGAHAKLVRCGRWVLFDVAVDIRRGLPTYCQWFGIELNVENGKQLLIPAGFAHGFVTRTPETEIIYKCSDSYAHETECALIWNDPDLGIDWGLCDTAPILSAKDSVAGTFAAFDSPFTYDGAA